jgi:SAM-dependent methyltransferase
MNQLPSMKPEQCALAEQALKGPHAEALLAAMFALNVHAASPPMTPPMRALAARLGWIQGDGQAMQGQLTDLGRLASDSIREHRFWVDRGRVTHGAPDHEALANATYRGKTVLEVGAGFGCNLMSLVGSAERVVGVEPTEVYRQMSPLLAAYEGLAPLDLRDGLGENLPFPNASFDVVLCYSSHQYMDTHAAFVEMARVLKPGGQLQTMSGTLGQFVDVMRDEWREHHRLGTLKHASEVVINTLSYQSLGRRLLHKGWLGTTAAPIYAQEKHLHRWCASAGLKPRADLMRRVGTSYYLFADKTGS